MTWSVYDVANDVTTHAIHRTVLKWHSSSNLTPSYSCFWEFPPPTPPPEPGASHPRLVYMGLLLSGTSLTIDAGSMPSRPEDHLSWRVLHLCAGHFAKPGPVHGLGYSGGFLTDHREDHLSWRVLHLCAGHFAKPGPVHGLGSSGGFLRTTDRLVLQTSS